MSKQPAVYILASKRTVRGFTQRYRVNQLVGYELHETMESAIVREKRIKNWKGDWKLELIESENPDWLDLYDTIV